MAMCPKAVRESGFCARAYAAGNAAVHVPRTCGTLPVVNPPKRPQNTLMAEAPGRPQVLIVGAGFGGLSAARALAQAPVDITVIDRRNFHLFQPLLYQVATAVLPPSEIAWPIRSVFA